MCVSSACILKDPWPWLCRLGVHVTPVCLSTYLWALVLHALRDKKSQEAEAARKEETGVGWGGVGGSWEWGGKGLRYANHAAVMPLSFLRLSKLEEGGGTPPAPVSVQGTCWCTLLLAYKLSIPAERRSLVRFVPVF